MLLPSVTRGQHSGAGSRILTTNCPQGLEPFVTCSGQIWTQEPMGSPSGPQRNLKEQGMGWNPVGGRCGASSGFWKPSFLYLSSWLWGACSDPTTSFSHWVRPRWGVFWAFYTPHEPMLSAEGNNLILHPLLLPVTRQFCQEVPENKNLSYCKALSHK
jgi:hypothetical protein